MTVIIGPWAKDLKLQAIMSRFRSASSQCLVMNDAIASEHLIATAAEIDGVKAGVLYFKGDNKDVFAEVNYGAPKYRQDHYKLGDADTAHKTGLSPAIQQVLRRDLLQYREMTGCYTTTRLFLGEHLQAAWNTAAHPKTNPVMLRDLSGQGLFGQAAGSRIFVRDELLAKLIEQPQGSRAKQLVAYTAARDLA